MPTYPHLQPSIVRDFAVQDPAIATWLDLHSRLDDLDRKRAAILAKIILARPAYRRAMERAKKRRRRDSHDV